MFIEYLLNTWQSSRPRSWQIMAHRPTQPAASFCKCFIETQPHPSTSVLSTLLSPYNSSSVVVGKSTWPAKSEMFIICPSQRVCQPLFWVLKLEHWGNQRKGPCSSWSLQKWKRDHEQMNVTSCNNISSVVPVSPGVTKMQRPTRGPSLLSWSLSEQGRLIVTNGGSLKPLWAWRFLSLLLLSPLCFLGGETPSSDPWSSPCSESSLWPPHHTVQHGPPCVYFPLTHS